MGKDKLQHFFRQGLYWSKPNTVPLIIHGVLSDITLRLLDTSVVLSERLQLLRTPGVRLLAGVDAAHFSPKFSSPPHGGPTCIRPSPKWPSRWTSSQSKLGILVKDCILSFVSCRMHLLKRSHTVYQTFSGRSCPSGAHHGQSSHDAKTGLRISHIVPDHSQIGHKTSCNRAQ